MISKAMQEAIHEQIKNELYSAYLYLAMSAQFEAESLPGFARWMRVQAKEETEHAMKFFDYVNDRGGRVFLKAIDAPPLEFGTPLEVFRKVLEHEQKVTSMINQLYALALKENDYASQVALQWFVSEQVEEEKNAALIIEQLKMFEEHKSGILQLDHQLGKRGED